MKPKLNHWCLIAFVDADPIVALCINVRQGEFYIPDRKDAAMVGCRQQSFDNDQVIAVLGPAQVPAIPAKLKHARID